MLRMGLFLAAILVPVQIFFGHLNGDYVHDYQPAKFAAIEARWHDEQPAGEVLIAIPDEQNQTNYFEIKVPVLGSLIGSMSFNSKEVGLTDFPRNDWPPVFIPFWSFRIMVGCGLIMLLLAWVGSYLSVKERLGSSRLMLWLIFLSFPLPFIAILTGWFTADASTVDGLWSAAYRGRANALPHRACRLGLTHRLLLGLHLNFHVRRALYSSPPAHRSNRPPRRTASQRRPQSSAVRCR